MEGSDQTIRTIRQRIYQEFKKFIVIACYLWIVFTLFVLYDSAVSSQKRITIVSYGLALLNALALGKVILVGDGLRMTNRFEGSPLIYATLFKSFVFAVFLGCFKILEAIVMGKIRGRTFSASVGEVGGGTPRGVFTLMLLLAILLIPFFGFSELGKAVGKERLRAAFFRSRHVLGTDVNHEDTKPGRNAE